MKVLVVGGGGREHALAWAINKSQRLERLYVAPGNGGTTAIAENVPIAADDIDSLVRFAGDNNVDLTVVGPETPLVGGIVDRFAEAGLTCFGPTQQAARLEGSKVFAKHFMSKHHVPTANFEVFDDAAAAKRRAAELGPRVVVKADGLAQGKGVVVAKSAREAAAAIDAIMVQKKFGDSGKRIIVEECLTGEEVSVHAICDGERAVLLPSSQDHKRVFDRDEGPNTGGMGAYAPVPFVGKELLDDIFTRVVGPTLRGMKSDGTPFAGVLYAGLMITRDGPQVLEYNVRFGDPETQAILPLLRSDVLQLLSDAVSGGLPAVVSLFEERFAATVVMAAKGYPGHYEKGLSISGFEGVENDRRIVFHAGTQQTETGLATAGGRVLAVTALAASLADAVALAYDGVRSIRFEGAHWRTDIGHRAL